MQDSFVALACFGFWLKVLGDEPGQPRPEGAVLPEQLNQGLSIFLESVRLSLHVVVFVWHRKAESVQRA